MIQDLFNPPAAQEPSHSTARVAGAAGSEPGANAPTDCDKSPAFLGSVVRTADGSLTLSHPVHGECYHTQAGAKAEARLLYVDSSGLSTRLNAAVSSDEPLRVLDVGLGLGLNATATLLAWAAAATPPPLALTSLEINVDLVVALASAAAPWQQNWSERELAMCAALRRTSPTVWTAAIVHPHGGAQAGWTIHVGDAATGTVPGCAGGYTHIWQDAFSPDKNPPLWAATWFEQLRDAAAAGCVLMTYSVAGSVRRALASAGWSWEKIPSLLPGKSAWLRAKT